MDACADSISPTGDQLGQVTEDFALLDQFGDTVNLHDFCGHTVLLVSSAEWCGPCNTEVFEV